jgi:hypothetical protein
VAGTGGPQQPGGERCDHQQQRVGDEHPP